MMNGYTFMLFCHFYRGKQAFELPVCLSAGRGGGGEPFKNGDLPLKERICSLKSKFFHLRVDPIEKGGKKENGRVASPAGVPIHLKVSGTLMLKDEYKHPVQPRKPQGNGLHKPRAFDQILFMQITF